MCLRRPSASPPASGGCARARRRPCSRRGPARARRRRFGGRPLAGPNGGRRPRRARRRNLWPGLRAVKAAGHGRERLSQWTPVTESSPPSEPEGHFDAVIVGSGFGGSVMASRLAEAGLSVCVLERGKAYPPGSFPRSPWEMGRNFWDPSEGLHGMFDVWSFRGIGAVVASGLGGGSLLWSNVVLRKDRSTFVKE